MTSDRVRAVQERRRSNAAGAHGGRATRADELADAIADWHDAGMVDDDEQVDPRVHVLKDVEIIDIYPVPGPNAWGGTAGVTSSGGAEAT